MENNFVSFEAQFIKKFSSTEAKFKKTLLMKNVWGHYNCIFQNVKLFINVRNVIESVVKILRKF